MKRLKKQDSTIQLALEAFKSTGYLIVNKTLIKKFGLVKASILSNYVDKYQYFLNKYDWFRGEFFLKHSDIMEQLNIKEPTIRVAKKEFIELGILSTRMKGTPAKEWIQINFQTLISLGLDPLKTIGLDPLKTGGLIRRTNNKENKDKDISMRAKEFLPLAEYLYKIISTNKNIKYNATNLKTWSNEIRKLSEINDIPYRRIKKALRWYKDNIGGKYIPIIESGFSLRMKFLNLEAARDRSENGYNTGVNKEDAEREHESWESKFGKK